MRNGKSARRRVMVGALAAAFAVIATPAGAAAEPETPRAQSEGREAAAPAYKGTCTVLENNVRYWTSPNDDQVALGQVHKGQKMSVIRRSVHGDIGGFFHHGDLWGGRKNVYINAAACWQPPPR